MKTTQIAWIATALLCLGCNARTTTPDDSKTSVKVQLNWYPESEHGGLYQALAEGKYDAAGIDVEVQSGGSKTPIGPELALQRCQFAIANADDVILNRQQGIDIVAVMAAMQNHPRCILAQKASGVESFNDLAGKTFQCNPGRPFVEFLRSKGLLDGVKEVPYHGSIANLVADPNTIIQAYSCAEPLLAQQQGIEVNTLMVSELGFNPYSSVLVTTGTMIREQPELVQKFVEITRSGWQNYLTDGTLGNAAILEANQEGMTAEALQFGSTAMRDLAIPEGSDIEQVGMMTAQRWSQLFDQLETLGLVSSDKVSAQDCYTLEFLQTRI